MTKTVWPIGVLALAVLSGCGPSSYQLAYNAALEQFVSAGKPLMITSFGIQTNSVGGVTPGVDAVNLSSKTIKYIIYDITPYNQVGDRQRSEISGVSTMHLRGVGPFPSMMPMSLDWDNAWYNGTIWCLVIDKVNIEYMDGTQKAIKGNDSVQQIIGPGFNGRQQVNYCRPSAG